MNQPHEPTANGDACKPGPPVADTIATYRRYYYTTHRSAILEANKRWRNRNREKVRAINKRAYVKMKAAGWGRRGRFGGLTRGHARCVECGEVKGRGEFGFLIRPDRTRIAICRQCRVEDDVTSPIELPCDLETYESPLDSLLRKEQFETAMQALDSINARNAKIMCEFARGDSYAEIGRTHNISAFRVYQIVKEVARKIRLRLQREWPDLVPPLKESASNVAMDEEENESCVDRHVEVPKEYELGRWRECALGRVICYSQQGILVAGFTSELHEQNWLGAIRVMAQRLNIPFLQAVMNYVTGLVIEGKSTLNPSLLTVVL